jgi:hypothetical protein
VSMYDCQKSVRFLPRCLWLARRMPCCFAPLPPSTQLLLISRTLRVLLNHCALHLRCFSPLTPSTQPLSAFTCKRECIQAHGPIVAMFLQDTGLFLDGVDIQEVCEALINFDFSKVGEGGSMGSAMAYPPQHW